MRSKMKNKSLCVLTAAAALCLGGAVAGLSVNALSVHADEVELNYYAFIDVGASDDAKAIDTALRLTEKNATEVNKGTVTAGDTLFESYSEGAEYSFALEAGTYQVAVAVIAESGTAVSVGGTAVNLGSAEGKYVASTTATVSDTLSVSVTGKLCAVLVAAEDSEILMSVEYTAGQVVPYGALLEEVLDKATGYYSNGAKKETEIDYNGVSASAGSGINTNFTTVDITGTVKGTSLEISRYVITMPEDLVYFINSGSSLQDNEYGEGEGADPYYSYNQTVFDYYGSSLINNGKVDGKVSKTGNEPGFYSNSVWSAFGDSAFPYNTSLWNKKNVTEMGYLLTQLTPGTQYRIYIGTLSHWHPRTVNITFNDSEVAGSETLRINASKGYTVYEGIAANSSGKIDINMVGGGTNEPCINFIAVQKMDTTINETPSKLEAPSIIGMEEHSLTITGGIQEGAKIQIYDLAKPNYILYEEKVNPEKIMRENEGDENSPYTYELDWGRLFSGVSRFCVVQVTNGGVSEAIQVSITDIEDFKATLTPDGYTAGTVTVTVTAHANSGIASWSYQEGEYGVVNEFQLDKPATMNESFTVAENGEFIIVVTSGLGVTYTETVVIENIDPERPVVTITPSKAGWENGAYNVTFAVKGTAPVAEYKLYKDGALLASAEKAPSSITFKEAGEYIIYVMNEAGQSVTNTLCVSEKPTMAAVSSNYANRTLTYTFADNASYKVESVMAYKVTDTRVTRMSVGSSNTMDVYDEGIYVVAVTTTTGTVEMFSLNVTEADLSATAKPSGDKNDAGDTTSKKSGNGAALGIGLGVGIGGIVLAAAAITVTLILTKKKA